MAPNASHPSATSAYTTSIAQDLGISRNQVQGTLELLEAGGTIPFIARYRKEATGSLDEVAIDSIRQCHEKYQELGIRRKSILETLEKNNLLTENLKNSLNKANSLPELEDIYLPFRPKRKTRGTKAREQGLAGLAKLIFEDKSRTIDFKVFYNPEQGVSSQQEALAGARDIIAEDIAENKDNREQLRNLFRSQATIASKVIEKNREAGGKFKDYFQWQEIANKAPGHRLLAMFRGQQQKYLKLTIRPPQENCIRLLKKTVLASNRSSPGPFDNEVILAIEDSYQRLLGPSLENELAKELKQKADKEAIQVFSENLRQLLLAPPLGQKQVLAIDPGYRTGCKVVCISGQGQLLHNTTIFPTLGENKRVQAADEIKKLVATYKIEAIGIGNGTAGRETEEFIKSLGLDKSIEITLVNEDGASIYSASAIAREEFPNHDITVRGAVSIGRRLQDPLAELVKLDPKSIGVGQYQHDVDPKALKNTLQTIVESCVNRVGVELNSTSSSLLTYVAGLNKTLAENIIKHRTSHGPFSSRKELLKVPRLGPKAFEQCAGFLRISQGENPLDGSGIHPERYGLIRKMAKDQGITLQKFLESAEVRDKIDLTSFTDENTGLPTLKDIIAELAKPGRDPREKFEQYQFNETIRSIDDLLEGMILPALITNITKFGAFADLGIKQDGLIHISQLADRFIKDPGEIVKLGQQVQVRVLDVDTQRNRISLSMKLK